MVDRTGRSRQALLRRRTAALAAAALLALAVRPCAGTLHPGQSDDFQDGTTQGWGSGAANPNPPVHVPDGGPAGAGDGFLRVEANGEAGPGGSLVAFNTSQWAGDYLRTRVGTLRTDLRNLGPADLTVRLLLEGPGGGFYTLDAASLPAFGPWQSFAFPVTPDRLAGGADALATLAAVRKLRILHAPTTAGGEPVEGVLGVDNVTALLHSVCEEAQLSGAAFGLCLAYCDALDCDRSGPTMACSELLDRFLAETGAAPPCEVPDADGDGVEDELDNCPDAANADQADGDGDGFGDVCDNCAADFNPAQEDSFGEPGVGDACDCPCFTAAEVAALLATLDDASTYAGLACVDTRVSAKPLTFVSAVRLDGASCATLTPECSALAVQFTEDEVCQLHAPAPQLPVTAQGIGTAQREACRARIVAAAAAAGLSCN